VRIETDQVSKHWCRPRLRNKHTDSCNEYNFEALKLQFVASSSPYPRLARKSWDCGQRKCFSGTENFQSCLWSASRSRAMCCCRWCGDDDCIFMTAGVRYDTIRYDTIGLRDAILTCAREPTRVSLICRTETTTKSCKTEKLTSKKTDMLKSRGLTVKVWGIV